MENLTSFTAIDFETANPSPTSACSVALVRVENNKVIDSFTTLLRPSPFVFSHWNVEVHGITEEMCKEAPAFNDIWPKINHWLVIFRGRL